MSKSSSRDLIFPPLCVVEKQEDLTAEVTNPLT